MQKLFLFRIVTSDAESKFISPLMGKNCRYFSLVKKYYTIAFRAWTLRFDSIESFPSKILLSQWENKDTVFLKNCQNVNVSKNVGISFITKSNVISKIEFSSLQQPLETCCMILFRHFIELEHYAKCSKLLRFLPFNSDIQVSAKWREKMLISEYWIVIIVPWNKNINFFSYSVTSIV